MAEWPELDDLRQWIRDESVSPTSESAVALSFQAADELIRDRLDDTAMLAKATAAGVDVDTPATLAAWCPSYVRQAILIRAAALYTRRDSANGQISFGEFASRVSKMDPDVDELIAPVRSYGIA
jgi:hypothetical protein